MIAVILDDRTTILEIVNSLTNKIGFGEASTFFKHIQTPGAAVEDTRKMHIHLKSYSDNFMNYRFFGLLRQESFIVFSHHQKIPCPLICKKK